MSARRRKGSGTWDRLDKVADGNDRRSVKELLRSARKGYERVRTTSSFPRDEIDEALAAVERLKLTKAD